MSALKTIAVAVALVFGASQLALAQSSAGPAGGGAGTESGKPGSAQNNDRGPGKDTGTGAMRGQDRP
jgi:hypothetical protein